MPEPVSMTDRAYADIKAKVLSGAYPPGAHFEAGQLADDLGMSRTPVREALLRLQGDGVLEIVAKKGIRVIPLSAADQQDIYQIITGLEVEAVGNLTKHGLTDEGLARLTSATKQMARCAEDGTIDGWSLADEHFHRSLFDFCGNSRLCAEGHRYRDLSQRAHFVALRLVDTTQKRKSAKSHADLVKIIESGDEAKARRVHFEQRLRGGEILINIVKNYGLNLL